MKRLTDEQYEEIARRYLAKGKNPKQVYEILEKANFVIDLDGDIYKNVYASRVMAIMHNSQTTAKPAKV